MAVGGSADSEERTTGRVLTVRQIYGGIMGAISLTVNGTAVCTGHEGFVKRR